MVLDNHTDEKIAGWPAHKDAKESRDIIQNVFNGCVCFAVCLKSDNAAIGCIELKLNGHTDMTQRDDECELGYWLGKPFRGQGMMPEAAEEITSCGLGICAERNAVFNMLTNGEQDIEKMLAIMPEWWI